MTGTRHLGLKKLGHGRVGDDALDGPGRLVDLVVAAAREIESATPAETFLHFPLHQPPDVVDRRVQRDLVRVRVERAVSFDRDREDRLVDLAEELTQDDGALLVVEGREERLEQARLNVRVRAELFRLGCGGEEARRETERFRDQGEGRVCDEDCLDELTRRMVFPSVFGFGGEKVFDSPIGDRRRGGGRSRE